MARSHVPQAGVFAGAAPAGSMAACCWCRQSDGGARGRKLPPVVRRPRVLVCLLPLSLLPLSLPLLRVVQALWAAGCRPNAERRPPHLPLALTPGTACRFPHARLCRLRIANAVSALLRMDPSLTMQLDTTKNATTGKATGLVYRVTGGLALCMHSSCGGRVCAALFADSAVRPAARSHGSACLHAMLMLRLLRRRRRRRRRRRHACYNPGPPLPMPCSGDMRGKEDWRVMRRKRAPAQGAGAGPVAEGRRAGQRARVQEQRCHTQGAAGACTIKRRASWLNSQY